MDDLYIEKLESENFKLKIDKWNLYRAITMLADIAIEHEGAFGMEFGGMTFEARWKVDNAFAYPKVGETKWDDQQAAKILESLRDYFKETLKVKNEGEA